MIEHLSDHFIEGISQNFIFILNISGISGILDYSASSSAEERFFTDLMVKCTLVCEDSFLREYVKAELSKSRKCRNGSNIHNSFVGIDIYILQCKLWWVLTQSFVEHLKNV